MMQTEQYTRDEFAKMIWDSLQSVGNGVGEAIRFRAGQPDRMEKLIMNALAERIAFELGIDLVLDQSQKMSRAEKRAKQVKALRKILLEEKDSGPSQQPTYDDLPVYDIGYAEQVGSIRRDGSDEGVEVDPVDDMPLDPYELYRVISGSSDIGQAKLAISFANIIVDRNRRKGAHERV